MPLPCLSLPLLSAVWMERLVALPLRALERLHAFVCGQVAYSFASPAHTDPGMPVRGAARAMQSGGACHGNALLGCQAGWLLPAAGLHCWVCPQLLAVRVMQGELARLHALGTLREGSDGSMTLALSAACVAQAVEHDRRGEVGGPTCLSGAPTDPLCWRRSSSLVCRALNYLSTAAGWHFRAEGQLVCPFRHRASDVCRPVQLGRQWRCRSYITPAAAGSQGQAGQQVGGTSKRCPQWQPWRSSGCDGSSHRGGRRFQRGSAACAPPKAQAGVGGGAAINCESNAAGRARVSSSGE
jgi:hypothetical protein